MARILVFDDSKLMRNLMARILADAGHQAESCEACSASDIQERIRSVSPDLVLTDYQMPGCNGLGVARMAHAWRADLPVLLVTATRDPDVEDALRRQQPLEILHKPVHEPELLATVTRLLG
ncbi:MAG TPA: response regulator [Holophagaceae bacterium]